MRRVVLGLFCLLLAASVWVPSLHLVFAPAGAQASKLAAIERRHLSLFGDPAARAREIGGMRRSNPEWDFMGRSFLVWALINRALSDPSLREGHLRVIDGIIDDTIRTETDAGMYHFLMSYAKRRPFVLSPARSQFLDGEIALMLGLRRLLSERDDYRIALRERVDAMEARMRQSPVLSAESYPDECWTFCNTIALASMAVADALDGTDHSELLRAWVDAAKRALVDQQTGILISSYKLSGDRLDGPEGSSIWLSAHMLSLVDEDFAKDQYARARKELSRSILGFGYAREWPVSKRGPMDVDSGPVIPGLDVSGGSSGLAFVAASAFGDEAYLKELMTTLDFAAFPSKVGDGLQYSASNQVGDAVLFYSMSLGPAWSAVRSRRRP